MKNSYISATFSKGSQGKNSVMVWERSSAGERIIKQYDAPYYFYYPDEIDGEFKDIYGTKLSKVSFDNSYEFYATRKKLKSEGIALLESDIAPHFKILEAEYKNISPPDIYCTYFDIEVDYDPTVGFPYPHNPYAPVSAVSLYHTNAKKFKQFVVLPSNDKWSESDIPKDLYDICDIVICKNEKELLYQYIDAIENSDIISGWNSDGYDIPYLYERLIKTCGISTANKLSFPNAPAPYYKESKGKYGNIKKQLVLGGRSPVDYQLLFKKFEQRNRPSYSMEAISAEITPELEKLEYEGTLYSLYHDNFPEFLKYNIRDSEFLKAMEEKLGYMTIAWEFAHSCNGLVENIYGTIKLADLYIISMCHDNGTIVPDVKDICNYNGEKYTGALVLDPVYGIHDYTGAIDIESLYPSSIRTLNISPETIIGQFSNNVDDFNYFTNDDPNKMLVLLYESGETESATVAEWKTIFTKKNWAVSGYGTVFDQNTVGFIPAMLGGWFNSRKGFKKKVTTAFLNMQTLTKGSKEWIIQDQLHRKYYKTQYILKIQLNSIYGALGNIYFRFYDIRLAESTTQTGRNILKHMGKQVGLILDGEYDYKSKSIAYGDTDSIYFDIDVSNVNDAITVCKIIERKVNKSFPLYVMKTFRVNEKFSDKIHTELDIISDKCILVSKKFYVMHVVFSENSITDEMKVMGLQIKKTILPKYIRVKLIGFVEKFLTGTPWDTIAVDVVKLRDSLYNSTGNELIKLGLPIEVNNVEEYTNRFDNAEKKLTVPGHVSASILYNKCIVKYNDTESYNIVSGMKIIKFILKRPIGRFKSIAIPYDMRLLPAWFTNYFLDNIDVDAHITRLIDNPLKTILTAIGEQPPTRKILLMKDTLEF